MNFNEISSRYESGSLVQRNASDRLIDLLRIGPREDVLDLGCGSGGITKNIAGMTGGRVLGIDPSDGMVREARSRNTDGNVAFEKKNAENFSYPDGFDVIFCNSAFQWFHDVESALVNCYQSLRKNGRMGIQAPATQTFCPNFILGLDKVRNDPKTSDTFSRFRNPWLFLESPAEYDRLFIRAGFRILFSKIERTSSPHTPEETYKIFESGAASGYMNPEYYEKGRYNEEYAAEFRRIMKESFCEQADKDGFVEVIFNRIYLIAVKE